MQAVPLSANTGTLPKAACCFQGRSVGGDAPGPSGAGQGGREECQGQGCGFPSSVKPAEKLTEVILPRRASANDLAVNHSGSREIGGKPGRIAARDRRELLRQQVGEKRRERCRWVAGPACKVLWTSKLEAGRCFASYSGGIYLGREQRSINSDSCCVRREAPALPQRMGSITPMCMFISAGHEAQKTPIHMTQARRLPSCLRLSQ